MSPVDKVIGQTQEKTSGLALFLHIFLFDNFGPMARIKRCLGTPAKLLRLALSLWMIADQVSDGLQTKTYWEYAQPVNATGEDIKPKEGSVAIDPWDKLCDAKKSNGNINSTVMAQRSEISLSNLLGRFGSEFREKSGNKRPPKPISIWYFRFAVVVWVMPPLLYMVIVNAMVEDGGDDHLLKMYTKRSPHFLWMFTIPFDVIKAAFVIYIVIPATDIILGLSELFLCRDHKRSKAMPGLKLFEQFGEAIPQATIAIIFYANHYKWLNSNDVLFDQDLLRNWSLVNRTTYEVYELPSLTKTLFSIMLSVGSILIGVIKGINHWKVSVAVVADNEMDLEKEAATRDKLIEIMERDKQKALREKEAEKNWAVKITMERESEKRASQEAEAKAKWRKEEKAKRESEILKRTIAYWKSLIPKVGTKETETETKVKAEEKAKIEADDEEKELKKGPN